MNKKSFTYKNIKNKDNKSQTPTILEGTLVDISSFISIDRADKPTLNKRNLSLKTEDNQLVFLEIRDKNLDMLIEPTPINIKDKVRVHILFQGSIKGDKRYNNIFVKKIELL